MILWDVEARQRTSVDDPAAPSERRAALLRRLAVLRTRQ